MTAAVSAVVSAAAALSLTAAFAAPARAQINTPPEIPAPTRPGVQNPLPFTYTADGETRREVRDPCIIRENGTYYLTFTHWPFANREESRMGLPDNGSSPGIGLYSSPDLKTWRFEKWLVKSSDLPQDCPYKHRFWAPEIHKIAGKFYLVFTADNWLKNEYNPAGSWGTAGYAFIGVSDKIGGPYQHITYVPGGACDTTLFGDETGLYAVMPKYDIHIRRLDLSGLDKSEIKWTSEEKTIVSCKNDDIGLAISPDYLEGPWVEKIGKKYVLFYAEIYKDKNFPNFLGYRTGAAYADTPLGPWKKDTRGQVFFGGHLSVFDGPDKKKWFAYRIENADTRRGFLAVDPFALDARGEVQATAPTAAPPK